MNKVNINKFRMSENLLYLLMWSAIFLVPVLNAEMTSQERVYLDQVLMAWYKTIPYFVIFILVNNIIIPRYLWTKRYIKFVVIILALCFGVFTLVDYLQRDIIPMLYGMGVIPDRITFSDLPIIGNVIIAVFVSAVNMGISLIYRSMESDEQMATLVRHNMQIEMEYLKYQINPHFFMNTLNNIHALIDIDRESAKSAVIELSKMMRYILYESGSESISLSNDIRFIKTYIELMKIRYDDSVEVNLVMSEHIPKELAVPPLLFIVFVENAFKHGIHRGKGSFINIEIRCEDDRLHCIVVNSLSRATKESSGGIGLINVRKRLELIYGDHFELINETREQEYYLHLTIPIEI